jgi:acyl-CoA synthetase (AMP-forming)/AMP-acid ligase II
VRIIAISDDPIRKWSDDRVQAGGDIGEITVRGELVTRAYFERPRNNRLAKISDGNSIWHRMGDLGWMDDRGRLWFCGRKSHRVVTPAGTLFTIPCEAVFNRHPLVFRSALVGVGPMGSQTPVICVELQRRVGRKEKTAIRRELLETAAGHPLTQTIRTVLFHPAFPVDIRHNSKIFREKLALWAQRRMARPKVWT